MTPSGRSMLIVMPSGQRRGGAEEALLQVARHRHLLSARPVFAILEEGGLADDLRATGAEVMEIAAGRLREPLRFYRTAQRLARVACANHASLILGWMTKGHLYGAAASQLTRIPAAYFQMGNPDAGIVDRICRRLPARGVLACSEFVRHQQQAVTSAEVIAVTLGAEIAPLEQAAMTPPSAMRRRLGLDETGRLVGIVARLQRWKGVHVFVEAMDLVRKKIPAVQGVIVGGPHDHEPGYADALARQIARLGPAAPVRMVGAQSNPAEWMQAMDIVVLASENEPFGIVVVEAMTLGKPVIATRPGGPEEMITPDLDGQLTPFGDAPALAAAIVKYLLDPGFAAACGKRARERAVAFRAAEFVHRLNLALLRWSPAAP